VRGHQFSIAATLDGHIFGVAIVGRPVSRIRDDGLTLELVAQMAPATPAASSQAKRRRLHLRLAFNESARRFCNRKTA
jgi:hypothetical protein